ncbi:kinase-like domain-containing protein [Rhizophagus clarus]|uniref:Kinase-like domain-containing protein n=1 Tax=Rhizophagus clarus TaxID=94130 RepID=A0A8H3QM43_9GLOM|nr:kinase-like domain-containing protein [Rhizophagus clarus]
MTSTIPNEKVKKIINEDETLNPDKKKEAIGILSKLIMKAGGFSEIYSADWNDGHYNEWNFENQQLEERKILFDEAKLYLTSISNKWAGIVQGYGLTQNQTDGNYMLVICRMIIYLHGKKE